MNGKSRANSCEWNKQTVFLFYTYIHYWNSRSAWIQWGFFSSFFWSSCRSSWPLLQFPWLTRLLHSSRFCAACWVNDVCETHFYALVTFLCFLHFPFPLERNKTIAPQYEWGKQIKILPIIEISTMNLIRTLCLANDILSCNILFHLNDTINTNCKFHDTTVPVWNTNRWIQ